jgi:hypothetical protein
MRKLLFALPVLVSCTTTPPPVDQLAAARASAGQAQAAAEADAPLELAQAQTKLARAEDAMQRGDYEEARRLAEQAEVDAKLASVLAQDVRAQRDAAEVDRSIDALRDELRKEGQ